ncbi:MAG: hypothetical protein KatS3mg008_0459 [Acidimicrobiales bacterium]|nr:MAG: hypothetical protein KatS3mg008_0459 [Acidimicrobiales bacterium]
MRRRSEDLDALFAAPVDIAAGARRRNGSGSSAERRVVVAVGVLAAACAVAGTASPAGTTVGDVVLRALVGFVLAVVCARARRWTWFVLCGVASSFSADAWAMVPGLVGLGVAFVSAVTDRRRRWIGAVVGALGAQSLLRLSPLDPYGLSTVLTLVAVCPPLVSFYVVSPSRVRRSAHLGAAAAGLVVVVGAAALAASAAVAVEDVAAGRRAAAAGFAAAGDGRSRAAVGAFEAAAGSFRRAETALSGPWTWPATMVPLLAQQREALVVGTRVGRRITESSAALASTVDTDRLRFEDGRIDVSLVQAASPHFARVAEDLSAAQDDLQRVERMPLFSPVRSKVSELVQLVDDAVDDARIAADVVAVAPDLLGAEGKRRYLVIFTQPAESRALGGFVGAWAEVEVEAGDLVLTRSGPIRELRDTPGRDERRVDGPADYVRRYARFRPWVLLQDVTISPDFPQVASVLAQVYPQTGFGDIDGVVAVDPVALGALMEFTGPVRVPGLRERIGPRNAAEFLMRDQYLRFAGDERSRREFLEDLSRIVFEELTTGDIPSPREASAVLDPVVEEGRLLAWSRHRREQEVFARLGLDGRFPRASGDLVGVVTQNAGNNKMDVFLERDIAYRAMLDPTTGELDATVEVRLTNTLDRLDLPSSVIGSNDRGLPPGTNRVWLEVYSPHLFRSAELDGEAVSLSSEREFGVWVYGTVVDVLPGRTRELRLRLRGVVDTSRGYSLEWYNQPLVNRDRVSVRVDSVGEALFGRSRGLAVTAEGTSASLESAPRTDLSLWVQVEKLRPPRDRTRR